MQSAERFTSNALAVLVVVPILAIFFLADGKHMADTAIQAVSSGRDRQVLSEIAAELNTGLKRYIRAKVILGVCSFTFYSAAMLLLGFPHAIALGFLGGVLEFIPARGLDDFSRGDPRCWFFHSFSRDLDGRAAGSLASFYGRFHLAARCRRKFGDPSAAGQIFAVMVGGEIGGIVGIYLSIPLMVVIRVIVQKCLALRAQPASELSISDGSAGA